MEIKTLAEILAENNLPTTTVAQDNESLDKLDKEFFDESFSSFPKQPINQPTKFASKKSNSYGKTHAVSKKHSSASKPITTNAKTRAKTNKTNAQAKSLTSSSKTLKSSTVKKTNPLQGDSDYVLKTSKTKEVQHTEKQSCELSVTPSTKQSDKQKSKLDNLPDTLQSQLKTPEQKQAEIDEIKANSRLRWLAFYYLSTREHSAEELKRKLLAKQQDPKRVDALLKEFAEKGYQSDMRTAFMLIREGIRKGRGRRKIKQDFYKRHLDIPSNIDELIDMANEESSEFVDVTDKEADAVNWLKLAVEARVKKYGSDIPADNKNKAKQLRFLQYRGFQSDICFEAIKHDLITLAER